MLKIKKQAMVFAMVDFSGGVPTELDLLGTFFSPGLLPPLSQSATRKGTGRDVYTTRRLRGLPSEVPLPWMWPGAEDPNVKQEKHSYKTRSKQVCRAGERKRDTPLHLWVLALTSRPSQNKTVGSFP